ncbi:MAG: phage recombination protein Bet [Candidatus Pacearchaeota archaeon]|nr:phage recombination protein Bet [Candidatus Pacearchaeota archaeon]
MGGEMNDLVTQEKQQLIQTLQNSLYVGAKAESVEMVISYCAAAGLDVMQKPAHIVPMNTKNPVTGQYEWRDVVMPGIGLYRIQADRSGTLAGTGEPEFGPDIARTFRDKNGNPVEMTFPEWCKVSMKKLVGGTIVEFISKEYWIENYATDSSKSDAPNAMWRKRPRGQLAKCAEAQALRKGWPEVGQAPTAEEMEGKEIDMGRAEVVVEPEQTTLPVYSDDDFNANFPAWEGIIKSGDKTAERFIAFISTKATLTEEQKEKLMNVEVDNGNA